MFFKKKKEIERLEYALAEKDQMIRAFETVNKGLAAELKETKDKLVASEADVAKYMDLYVRATRKEKPAEADETVSAKFKVPHCRVCRYHERAGMDGRYVHICTASGCRRVRGNDARVSPHWCPLRRSDESKAGGDDRA